MFSNLFFALGALFLLWLLYEAWRTPLFRENEDGSFTALTEPKSLKELWLKIKGKLKKLVK